MRVIKQLGQRLFAQIYVFLRRQDKYLKHRTLIEQGLLVIGRNTYGTPIVDVYRGSERKVSIGSFCSISRGVVIVTGGVHPVNWVSTFPFRAQWHLPGAYADGIPTSDGDIVIGSDVWIGTEAMILSGVTIGDGAVIAARSVVTRDVPPYAIVAGVPARIIRYRFDQCIIDQLLEIKWWEWDDEQIRQAVPLLSSERIDDFLVSYGKGWL